MRKPNCAQFFLVGVLREAPGEEKCCSFQHSTPHSSCRCCRSTEKSCYLSLLVGTHGWPEKWFTNLKWNIFGIFTLSSFSSRETTASKSSPQWNTRSTCQGPSTLSVSQRSATLWINMYDGPPTPDVASWAIAAFLSSRPRDEMSYYLQNGKEKPWFAHCLRAPSSRLPWTQLTDLTEMGCPTWAGP